MIHSPPAKPLQPLIPRSKVGGDVNGYDQTVTVDQSLCQVGAPRPIRSELDQGKLRFTGNIDSKAFQALSKLT